MPTKPSALQQANARNAALADEIDARDRALADCKATLAGAAKAIDRQEQLLALQKNEIDRKNERIGELEAAIMSRDADMLRQGQRVAEEQKLARAALAERDEAQKQFADLKERLANAEARAERAGGYIDRVRETDRPRGGSLTAAETASDVNYAPPGRKLMGEAPSYRRPHWTHYGNR